MKINVAVRVRWMFVVLIVAFGCSNHGWIDAPPQISHGITAVGVSAETHDPAAMRTLAAHQARLEIARVLDVRVQEVIKDWARVRREVFSNADVLQRYFESVSRSILNIPLPNVRIIKYHFDEKERRMYALAVLDFHRALPDVRQILKGNTEGQLTFPSPQAVDRAFDELDTALEKIR